MENKFKSPITKEIVALVMIKATLEGKISGFKKGLAMLDEDVHPETLGKVNFAIQELEEVLTTLNNHTINSEWSN